MKLRFFIVAAAVLAFAACKTPYKATDSPMPAKNTTASADTIAMNKTTPPADTTSVSKMDSISKPLTGIPKTDSMMIKAGTDSAMNKTGVDSTHMQTTTESTKMTPSTEITTQAPAAVEAVFVKQYPKAANTVWSRYDSLANVPIDMRLTGWKKMDTEDHMVKFESDGETYYAWYDSNGKWIGSASPMTDLKKLPPAVTTAVNNAIKTRYAGYTVSQVNREFQTGKKSYEVELTKDDNKVRMLVNSAGKITQIYRYKAENNK